MILRISSPFFEGLLIFAYIQLSLVLLPLSAEYPVMSVEIVKSVLMFGCADHIWEGCLIVSTTNSYSRGCHCVKFVDVFCSGFFVVATIPQTAYCLV